VAPYCRQARDAYATVFDVAAAHTVIGIPTEPERPSVPLFDLGVITLLRKHTDEAVRVLPAQRIGRATGAGASTGVSSPLSVEGARRRLNDGRASCRRAFALFPGRPGRCGPCGTRRRQAGGDASWCAQLVAAGSAGPAGSDGNGCQLVCRLGCDPVTRDISKA
jgi:hypothetical protein